jgi:hypothetical protein
MRVLWYAVGFAFLDIFPLSFYGGNLKERINSVLQSLRLCLPAFLNIITLLILIISITLVAGIYIGATSWFKEYIETNDMPRIVEINAISDANQVLIQPSTLVQFAQIKDASGAKAVQQAHGWSDALLHFYDKMGVSSTDVTLGRTIDPADPLLDSLEITWPLAKGSKLFESHGVGQVMVSHSLLKELKYDPTQDGFRPPEFLQIHYNGMPCQVRVSGVCKSIRGRNDFLMTEEFSRQITDRLWQPANLHRAVILGPLPKGIDRYIFEAKVQMHLADHLPALSGSVQKNPHGGRDLVLSFGRNHRPKPRSLWKKTIVPQLQKAFPKELKKIKLRFGQDAVRKILPLDPKRIRHLKASVYVNKLEQVPDVVDALKELGFNESRDAKAMAMIFIQISTFGQGVILAVIVTVGLLTAISISLSFAQRIQRKIPEIGILKAFGTGDFLIFLIYSFEAFMIWAGAMLLSWGIINWAAAVVNDRLVEIFTTQGAIRAGSGLVNIVAIPSWLLLTVGWAHCCCAGFLPCCQAYGRSGYSPPRPLRPRPVRPAARIYSNPGG